jgi:hypothetical protein
MMPITNQRSGCTPPGALQSRKPFVISIIQMKSFIRLSRRIFLSLAIVSLASFLTACGGRMLNKNMAQNLVTSLPGDITGGQEAYVEAVNQTDSRNVVIETRLHAAFRFQKVNSKWLPREVRLGSGAWENIDNIIEALQRVKTERTQKTLTEIADAIGKYCSKNGALPPFSDYVSLSDVLVPVYITPLIRLDAWDHPLSVERLNANTIRLISAGPDGRLTSGDDIEVTWTFPGR